MIKFSIAVIYFLLSTPWALAHEGEEEITNLAQADWLGPGIALVGIVAAVYLARFIRTRSKSRSKPGPNKV